MAALSLACLSENSGKTQTSMNGFRGVRWLPIRPKKPSLTYSISMIHYEYGIDIYIGWLSGGLAFITSFVLMLDLKCKQLCVSTIISSTLLFLNSQPHIQPTEDDEENEHETYESYGKDTSDFYASDMRDTFEKLCTRCSEKMPPHFINIWRLQKL